MLWNGLAMHTGGYSEYPDFTVIDNGLAGIQRGASPFYKFSTQMGNH